MVKQSKLWMLTSCRACSRSTKRASSLCARSIAALAAILFCGAGVFTACMSNDDNAVTLPRQRVIAFEGIENGRDMGGLVMQDGRTVRFDMLVRSGNLSTATDADVAILKNQYHLTDVFDFRFDGEVAAAPDRQIDGVSYTHLSTLPKAFIEGFSPGSSSSEEIDTRDLGALLLQKAFDPNAQAMARQLYPAIVTDSTAQRYYGEFLRGVLAAKGGVLWHCSQGKDRAGWASAFVLAALGASREVIVEDFDLSNQSYADKVEALSAMVRDQEGGDEAEAFIRAMIGVSRENFEATLDLIDQRYGSLSGYIEHQLGFSQAEQQQLRAKYLSRDNPSNNLWGAETLTFKVNSSTDELIMKKVEGGDYSMEYMYESQVTTVSGTLSF